LFEVITVIGGFIVGKQVCYNFSNVVAVRENMNQFTVDGAKVCSSGEREWGGIERWLEKALDIWTKCCWDVVHTDAVKHFEYVRCVM